jgi:hypothetical protein
MGRLNLPTVVKTAIPPGDAAERLFVATQPGEIYFLRNGVVETFLNISPRIIRLGAFGAGMMREGCWGWRFIPVSAATVCFIFIILSQGHKARARCPNPSAPTRAIHQP